mgnify:CR=1 FL=1
MNHCILNMGENIPTAPTIKSIKSYSTTKYHSNNIYTDRNFDAGLFEVSFLLTTPLHCSLHLCLLHVIPVVTDNAQTGPNNSWKLVAVVPVDHHYLPWWWINDSLEKNVRWQLGITMHSQVKTRLQVEINFFFRSCQKYWIPFLCEWRFEIINWWLNYYSDT